MAAAAGTVTGMMHCFRTGASEVVAGWRWRWLAGPVLLSAAEVVLAATEVPVPPPTAVYFGRRAARGEWRGRW